MMISEAARNLALACVLLCALVTAASPRACVAVSDSGLPACWTHDASIGLGKDGKLTRIATGMSVYESSGGPGGPWLFTGTAFSEPVAFYWAPEIMDMGDHYLMLYSNSSFGTRQSNIGYATSPTLAAGSWTDHGATGVRSKPGNDYNAIDGALFKDGDAFYMVFGSFFAGLFVVPMTEGGRHPAGLPWNVVGKDADGNAVEAPFVVQEAGRFWLFFSHGKCCNYAASPPAPGQEYKIKVCRSRMPMGPYTDLRGRDCRDGHGDMVLQSGPGFFAPGGQSLFRYGGEWIMHYQYVTSMSAPDGQKKYGWNVVSFDGALPTLS